jgi:hypothetical protein
VAAIGAEVERSGGSRDQCRRQVYDLETGRAQVARDPPPAGSCSGIRAHGVHFVLGG